MLASIYIRKDDEDKWRELKNKTERVSQMLNASVGEATGVVHKAILCKHGKIVNQCRVYGCPNYS